MGQNLNLLQREKRWEDEVHGKSTRNKVSARDLGGLERAGPDDEAHGKTGGEYARVCVQSANTQGSPATAHPPFPTPNTTLGQGPGWTKGQCQGWTLPTCQATWNTSDSLPRPGPGPTSAPRRLFPQPRVIPSSRYAL